ncbi:MAG: hypothetical protein U0872_13935 [Planctomycetaceae bacterium]
MADATNPSHLAASPGKRTANRRPAWQTRIARCRTWLRELSTRFAWVLVARHATQPVYCPVARNSGLAVLLHGLDRDIALSHICAPVHSFHHAASARWDSGVSLKRSPLLTR